MKAAAHRSVTSFLVGLVAVLGCITMLCLLGWGTHASWRDLQPASVLSLSVESMPDKSPSATMSTYAVIWEHPLFSQDRLPGASLLVDSNKLPLDGLTLTGTVTTDSAQWAILRDARSGKSVRLGPGQTYDGMTLAAVSPRSARLERSGEIIELVLQPGSPAHADQLPSSAAVDETAVANTSGIAGAGSAPPMPPRNPVRDSVGGSGDDAAAREASLDVLKAEVLERRSRKKSETGTHE